MPVRPLPEALAVKAKKELNEDPSRLDSDIQHIKDWLDKQQYIRARTDDQFLAAFLRACKFSLERTKQKIELYYSLKEKCPEFFHIKHTEPRFREGLDSGAVVILPKTASPDSPRIQMIRPGAYDAEKFHILEIMGISFYLHQICFMEDDNATVSGIETVLDLEGVTWGHFVQMTPGTIKKMVMASQDAAPIRLKGTHIINTPPGFETIYNIVSSLLNEKNRERLMVHNQNYEAMYKLIPKDILPMEYGGSQGAIKDITEVWQKKVTEYSSFLEEDSKHGIDVSKRPAEENADSQDSFGVEGSFRKLQVD